MFLESPGRGEGIQVEIRGDSKMVLDWINGEVRQSSTGRAFGNVEKQMREWWGRAVNLRRREDDWTVHILREHIKEADAWAVPRPRFCSPLFAPVSGFVQWSVSPAKRAACDSAFGWSLRFRLLRPEDSRESKEVQHFHCPHCCIRVCYTFHFNNCGHAASECLHLHAENFQSISGCNWEFAAQLGLRCLR